MELNNFKLQIMKDNINKKAVAPTATPAVSLRLWRRSVCDPQLPVVGRWPRDGGQSSQIATSSFILCNRMDTGIITSADIQNATDPRYH
jgi:hypothetical protein